MEPDSNALLIFLLLVAAAALYALLRSRRWFLKVGCAVLAVALAMLAGMAVVNDAFGYYRSWSALNADLTGDYNAFGGAPAATRTIAFRDQHGYLEQVDMAGTASRFNRPALVYLPPQYYQPKYAAVRFPVVELIHGSPGNPRSWTVHLNAVQIVDKLISAHLMGPVVLVMPTSNANHDFEECLNSKHGLDDTYISAEVPADTMRRFRVATDRSEWGIAGLSSGGYCAANLSLRHRGDYGAVGIMDGYFRPRDGEAAGELGYNRRAEAANNPLAAARSLSATTSPLPPFWLSAGSGDRADFVGARAFTAALQRVDTVSLTVEPGARHNLYAWEAALPHLLTWMWQQLATPALRVTFPTRTANHIAQVLTGGQTPRLVTHGPAARPTASTQPTQCRARPAAAPCAGSIVAGRGDTATKFRAPAQRVRPDR